MTTRNLTSAMETAIAAGKVRPVIFVEGSFYASGSPDEEFLRLWSGLGDFSWDSKTWTGAGKLLRLSPLEESAEVKAVGFNIELSGLPPSLLSLALDNVRQGRPGRVWLGLMGREGYLSLPGVSGNYASTPDSAAVSVTGDIDIRVKVALDDWTPTITNYVVSKAATPGQYAFDFLVGPAGTISFGSSTDGTAFSSATSSVATGFSDGSAHWIRVTRAASSGQVIFYTSEDGVAWSQLGVAQTNTAGAIYDSTEGLAVAAQPGGNAPIDGKVYSAEIRNGIDGTVVASFDPSTDAAQGVKSFVSSTTGETWTINQSGSTRAEIVMNENHLLADPYLVRAGRMDYCNIAVSGDDTVIRAQYEDRLIDLQRPRERRYTDQDQKNDYPTDGGFRFVAGLQDKQLIWGGPGAASSPIAQPSYEEPANAPDPGGPTSDG